MYTDVTIESISTAGHQGRFTDVILPCQSYMARVSGSVAFCSDVANLEKFSHLSVSFRRAAFSPTYDPWTNDDSFGRSNNYKFLQSSRRAILSGPKKSSTRSETEDSVVDESALKPTANGEGWKGALLDLLPLL